MPRRKTATSPQTEYDVLREDINEIKKSLIPLKAAGPTNIQTFAISQHGTPSQGEMVLDHVHEIVFVRHRDRWIPLGLAYAKFNIKTVSDLLPFIVGDGLFKTSISSDMDGYELYDVSAYVSTVGSGTTTIQISNRTASVDMLSTPITIASGQYDSYASAAPVINTANALVQTSDRLWIDIDANGGGTALGLGVRMFFRIPGVG